MALQVTLAGFFLLFLWLALLSFYFWRYKNTLSHILQGSSKKSLDEIISSIIRNLHIVNKDIEQIKERCDTIEKDGKFHMQKVGLLRFNPFKDTGGDQSFIIALTDAYDTGIVITALYSRTGTRWYTKKVVNGKGFEHELSDEEGKALKIAKNIK